MPHYRATLETDKPPEEVFDYMADFTHTADWDPGVTHAERTSDGPAGENCEFRIAYSMLGFRQDLRYRMVEYNRPHHVVLRCETPSMSLTDRITVTPQDAGSCLTYDAEIALKGPLKLLGGLVGLGFRQAGDRARDGLSKVLEATT